MSSPSHNPTEMAAELSDEQSPSRDELTVQVELLRERNRRLREEYLQSQQQTYQRSAIGLFIVGIVGLLAGVLFPSTRTVLVALGGTGIFAAILTYTLTPERFIAESVSSGVYEALVADRTALLDELGISGTPVYVPGESPRLYIPSTDAADSGDFPSVPDDLSSLFVVTNGTPGITLAPTGGPLFSELERSLSGSAATTPEPLVAQLTDGLVEDFELVDAIDTDVDPEGGRVTVEFTGVAYGNVDRIDHPVVSLVATGLAVGLDTAVLFDVEDTSPPLITYRWEK